MPEELAPVFERRSARPLVALYDGDSLDVPMCYRGPWLALHYLAYVLCFGLTIWLTGYFDLCLWLPIGSTILIPSNGVVASFAKGLIAGIAFVCGSRILRRRLKLSFRLDVLRGVGFAMAACGAFLLPAATLFPLLLIPCAIATLVGFLGILRVYRVAPASGDFPTIPSRWWTIYHTHYLIVCAAIPLATLYLSCLLGSAAGIGVERVTPTYVTPQNENMLAFHEEEIALIYRDEEWYASTFDMRLASLGELELVVSNYLDLTEPLPTLVPSIVETSYPGIQYDPKRNTIVVCPQRVMEMSGEQCAASLMFEFGLAFEHRVCEDWGVSESTNWHTALTEDRIAEWRPSFAMEGWSAPWERRGTLSELSQYDAAVFSQSMVGTIEARLKTDGYL